MERLVAFFRSKGFATLLFYLGVLLFSWPLLALPENAGGSWRFAYIIIAWAFIVLMLGVVGYSLDRKREGENE